MGLYFLLEMEVKMSCRRNSRARRAIRQKNKQGKAFDMQAFLANRVSLDAGVSSRAARCACNSREHRRGVYRKSKCVLLVACLEGNKAFFMLLVVLWAS